MSEPHKDSNRLGPKIGCSCFIWSLEPGLQYGMFRVTSVSEVYPITQTRIRRPDEESGSSAAVSELGRWFTASFQFVWFSCFS